MKKLMLRAALASVALFAAACTTTGPAAYDYTAFRQEAPASILVLPAHNNTLNVNAPDYFLSTLSRPIGERGYYVFPAHMVKRTLEDNGLSDTGLVYSADTRRLGDLFGCDAAIYVSIDRWESQYAVLATSTNVEFEYEVRSCRTGEALWTHTEAMSYTPQADSTGNVWADLIAAAVVAAVEKAAPNYMPLARQANTLAFYRQGRGLPAGPYQAELYNADLEAFPDAETKARMADAAE
ncbi:MAG: GNA1162 family protein [Oceanicaulis sp.]